jgi:hypothetical protein
MRYTMTRLKRGLKRRIRKGDEEDEDEEDEDEEDEDEERRRKRSFVSPFLS